MRRSCSSRLTAASSGPIAALWLLLWSGCANSAAVGEGHRAPERSRAAEAGYASRLWDFEPSATPMLGAPFFVRTGEVNSLQSLAKLNDTSVGNECITALATTPVDASQAGWKVQISTDVAQSSEEAYGKLAGSAEVSGGGAVWSAAVSARLLRESRTTSKSIHVLLMVTADMQVPDQGGLLRGVHIHPRWNGRRLEDFAAVCGQGFVSNRYYGGRFSAVIVVESVTSAERSAIEATFRGRVWSTTMGASLQQEVSKLQSRYRATTKVVQLGGTSVCGALDCMTDTEPRLLQLAESFKRQPAIVGVEVRPYDAVDPVRFRGSAAALRSSLEQLSIISGYAFRTTGNISQLEVLRDSLQGHVPEAGAFSESAHFLDSAACARAAGAHIATIEGLLASQKKRLAATESAADCVVTPGARCEQSLEEARPTPLPSAIAQALDLPSCSLVCDFKQWRDFAVDRGKTAKQSFTCTGLPVGSVYTVEIIGRAGFGACGTDRDPSYEAQPFHLNVRADDASVECSQYTSASRAPSAVHRVTYQVARLATVNGAGTIVTEPVLYNSFNGAAPPGCNMSASVQVRVRPGISPTGGKCCPIVDSATERACVPNEN